jgi:hypothetical protein
MLELLAEFGLKVSARLAPWIVRRFYKVQKLEAGLKIRIVEAHEGVWINGGELPRFRAWLRITNLTPFDLTFDRIYGDLYHGSKLAEFRNLDKVLVPTASEKEIAVEADLTSEHVMYVRRNLGNRFDTYLRVSAHVKSRLHDFEIVGREVKTKNVELVNCPPLPATNAKAAI